MRELIISTILDALTHSATITAVPGRRARRFVSQLDGLTPRRDHVLDTPVAARYVADNEKVAIRGTAVRNRWAHLTVFNRLHSLLELA